MIDTIVLTFTKDMFIISQPDRFTPSARWALAANTKQFSGIQSKQNPTKKELIAGIYKPRLTLSNRVHPLGGQVIMLKVELSLPKLLYGNNFDELQYKDFKAVKDKLVLILEHMGVIITPAVLAKAPISAIHYAKNIALTDGSIPYHYINKIKEANIKFSFDVNQTDYRNDGHCYKWHCNSYEVAFYDKILDLAKAKQSSKRSVEKDSDIQLDLFKTFETRNKFEVLRIEARLNKRSKIKQLFKTLGIKADLTFKKLFKPAIAKKVLVHYLDELESKRSVLLDYKPKDDKSLLTALIINNPTLSSNKIMQMFGFKKALETCNTRELRTMLTKYNQRSWHRLMADVRKVKLPVYQSSFEILRGHILHFKALKIASYLTGLYSI